MQSRMGLIGFYNSSTLRDDISSVYMISDKETASLFVFILFPGSFHDVYEIASLTAYQNIFIIPISMSPEYISDIYRLVDRLTPIKARVKIMTPELLSTSMKASMGNVFLNAIIKGSTKSQFVYSENGFIAFDWNDGENGKFNSDEEWPGSYHDIYCTFGNKSILLTVNKVDVDRIISMFKSEVLDYVYVPWQICGYIKGNIINFESVYNRLKEYGYQNKIVPYGFPDAFSIAVCKEKYQNNFPIIDIDLEPDAMENIYDFFKLSSITYGEAVNTCDHHHAHLPNHHHDHICHHHNLHIQPPPPPPHHHHHDHECDKKHYIPAPYYVGYPSHLYCPICDLQINMPNKPIEDGNVSASVLATEIMASICPNLGKWAATCENSCEECPIKEYFSSIDETPDNNDNTENPNENEETGGGQTPDETEPGNSGETGSDPESNPNKGDISDSEAVKPDQPSSDNPSSGTSDGTGSSSDTENGNISETGPTDGAVDTTDETDTDNESIDNVFKA